MARPSTNNAGAHRKRDITDALAFHRKTFPETTEASAVPVTVTSSLAHRFRDDSAIERPPSSLGRNDRAHPPFTFLLSPGLPSLSGNGKQCKSVPSKTMCAKDYETETRQSSGCRFVLEPPINSRVRFTETLGQHRRQADGCLEFPPLRKSPHTEALHVRKALRKR